MGWQAQQLQDLQLQGSEWCHVVQATVWELNDSQIDVRKRLQEPFGRRGSGALLGVLWVQTNQGGLGLLEAPPDDELNERQHTDGQAEQMGQADHLVIPFDKEWGQGQRSSF